MNGKYAGFSSDFWISGLAIQMYIVTTSHLRPLSSQRQGHISFFCLLMVPSTAGSSRRASLLLVLVAQNQLEKVCSKFSPARQTAGILYLAVVHLEKTGHVFGWGLGTPCRWDNRKQGKGKS